MIKMSRQFQSSKYFHKGSNFKVGNPNFKTKTVPKTKINRSTVKSSPNSGYFCIPNSDTAQNTEYSIPNSEFRTLNWWTTRSISPGVVLQFSSEALENIPAILVA